MFSSGGKPLYQNNQPVQASNDYDADARDGEVHVLILALDYKHTNNSLTCSMDGRNMEKLANACGIADVVAMYDEQCTKENVVAAIQQIGERVGEDDYLVIYYSGHGTGVPDESGDESDGQDEAFCFVPPDGQISYETCMTDDVFSEVVTDAIDEEANIIILTDCCHSGTIADLESELWEDRKVVAIAGCTDEQTSGDMGRGGIFTHSLLLAIDQLQKAEHDDYSCGMVYNATLDNDEQAFHSAQDITIQSTAAVEPRQMAWPLIPTSPYSAPLSQASQQVGGAENIQGAPPEMLQQLGINPSMLGSLQDAGILDGKIDPQKLLSAGLQMYMRGECKADSCALM